jgi:RNA-binding protein YhbY
METKIFKNYNEFGSRTNKSTNGVTEDFLKDINKTLEDRDLFKI